jgi:hypothetical protein
LNFAPNHIVPNYIVNAIRDREILDEIQKSSVNDLRKFIDLISTPKTLEIQENIEIENDGTKEITFTKNEETTNMNSPEPKEILHHSE